MNSLKIKKTAACDSNLLLHNIDVVNKGHMQIHLQMQADSVLIPPSPMVRLEEKRVIEKSATVEQGGRGTNCEYSICMMHYAQKEKCPRYSRLLF